MRSADYEVMQREGCMIGSADYETPHGGHAAEIKISCCCSSFFLTAMADASMTIKCLHPAGAVRG